MKKLLTIVVCLLSSLSVYSQDAKTPFWAIMSFDANNNVTEYQEFERTVSDQLKATKIAANYSWMNYGYLPNEYSSDRYKYTQPAEFITKIQEGYCFVGDQQQAYNDLFFNTNTLVIKNVIADDNGEYTTSEKIPGTATKMDIPVEETYSITLDGSLKLNITLVKEKACTELTYVRTDDAGDHPGAATWDVYKCNKWVETTLNKKLELTACTNWEAPLKEYFMKIYNLPKEIF